VDVWDSGILEHVDDRTRAVVLSTLNFATGATIARLRQAADSLRSRGVLVVIDAIQTLGAGPFSVEGYDAVVAGAHKWLLVRQPHFVTWS
jgi:selenocysteine lyase/cysteine desulfurase